MRKFEVGEIVRLKSGGPKMTVQRSVTERLTEHDDGGQASIVRRGLAHVMWFDEDKHLNRDAIPTDMLISLDTLLPPEESQ